MPEQIIKKRRKSPLIGKLARAVPAIRTQYGVTKIGIFGSFARGEQTRTSDVDILVEFSEGYATLRNFVGLSDHLEQILSRKIDLLTVGAIDKYIRPYIEAEVIWLEG